MSQRKYIQRNFSRNIIVYIDNLITLLNGVVYMFLKIMLVKYQITCILKMISSLN